MLCKICLGIIACLIGQSVFAQPQESYSPPTCGYLKKVIPLQIDGVSITELEIEEENGNIVYFHIDPLDESSQNCTEVKGLMCWDIKGWVNYRPNIRDRLMKRLYLINNCVAPD